MQDARNYMLAAVLLPAFEQGQMQFHSFMGKPEMAVITGQAREQRNIQWMAEGSLFMNIARPMMAFFEGFLYAITPFMALLVAFVPAGIGLVGKYFMMFVWVQLWMPVMAVLNHYTQIVAQKKLACLIDGDIPLTSLQGHLMGVSQLNDWLGTAGVLAASTPAISLALLYGGAITMTHLAGRLQHGDFVDEKIARPDVVRPAPLLNMNSQMTAGDSFGLRKTGMEPAAGEINVSDMAPATVASTRSEAQTSGLTATESLKQTISSGIAGTSGIRSGVTTHDGRSSTMSTGEAFAQAYTDKLGYGTTWTADQNQALKGMFTAGLGVGVTGTVGTGGSAGGLKLGVGGKIGADARGQLEQIFGTTEGQRVAQQIENDARMSGGHDLNAVMQDSVSRDLSSSQTAEYLKKYGNDKLQDTQRAFRRHYDAQRRFSEASQMSRSLGSNAKINLLQAADIWKEKHGSAIDYASRIAGATDGLHRETQIAQAVLRTTSAKAGWVGLTRRLQNMARKGDTSALQALVRLREDAHGLPPMALGDPQQYKDIAPSDMSAQADRVEQRGRGMTPLSDREVEGGLAGIKGDASGPMYTKDGIEGTHLGNTNSVINRREGELKRSILAGHEQALKHQENLMGPLKNEVHSATQMAGSALQTVKQYARAKGGAAMARAGLTNIYERMTNPDYRPDENDIKALQKNQAIYRQSLVAEGKARGLSDKEAELYAAHRGQAFNDAVKSSYGHDLGMSSRNPRQIETEALADKARFYREHAGATPEMALDLAKRDMNLIKDSGSYGGINYVAPVGQVWEKVGQLEKAVQSSRHQALMGGPGAGARGIKPLRDGVAKDVHTFDDIIERAAQRHDVDPNLIRAVISQESQGNPGIVNPKSGATGLMQLTPKGAGAGMTDAARKNPEQNIMRGTEYLKQMLDKYHGNEEMALAAYNAGPGNVDKNVAMTFKETRHFVPQVLAYRKEYANQEQITPMGADKQAQDIKAINPDLASMRKVDYVELKKRTGVKDQ